MTCIYTLYTAIALFSFFDAFLTDDTGCTDQYNKISARSLTLLIFAIGRPFVVDNNPDMMPVLSF